MIFSSSGKNYQMNLNTDRFDRQFLEAQKKLNMLVVADSTPYIPHKGNQLREQVDYPQGIYGGEVRWYAPYAHYQYNGEIYGDPKTGAGGFETADGWKSRRGVPKVPTGRPLTYHEPGTGDHWFERAKETHKAEWVRTVKRIGGGGV